MTVAREAEWDDESREQMLALAEYEAGVCACGFHKTLTRDKSNVFSPETDHCPVCAGWATYGRIQAKDDREQEERLGKDPAPKRPRPGDGRRVFMRMTPAGSVPQQAPSEQGESAKQTTDGPGRRSQ